MIKLFFIAIISMFLVTAYAQETIEVSDITKTISKGDKPGLSVFIPFADQKTVEKEWIKYIENPKLTNLFKKSTDKNKVEKYGDEYFTSGAIIKELGEGNIDLYALINQIEGGIRVYTFFETKDGFISPEWENQDQYSSARNFTRNFGVLNYKIVVNDELRNENKTLERFENELKKLEQKNDRLRKSINRSDLEINKNESAIQINVIDQEKSNSRIAQLKDTLYTFDKKSFQYETFKEKLKTEKKDHKKLHSNNKSYNKKIQTEKNQIINAQEEIKTNLVLIEEQKNKISGQNKVVEEVEEKLLNIK